MGERETFWLCAAVLLEKRKQKFCREKIGVLRCSTDNLRTIRQPFPSQRPLCVFGELPQVLCIQNIMNNVIDSFLDSSSFATTSCVPSTPFDGTTSTPWTTRPHALSLLRRTTLHRGIEGRSDRRNHEHRSRSKAGNRGRSTSRCSKSKTPSSSISSAPGFPIRPPSVPQLVQSHESHSGVLPAARRQSFDACLFGYDAM